MRIIKTDPVGIDVVIDRIQKASFDFLTTTAGWTNYESYHRAYKNPKDGRNPVTDNVIPEVYTGDGEYKEVFFDDTFNVTSFFLADDNAPQANGLFTTGISIIYQAKLDQLYPNVPHRADEEMHQDIVESIKEAGYWDHLKQITTGYKNVYSDLNFSGDLGDMIKLDDMSFFHVVKIDLEVSFNYICSNG